jgi:hypothetical protein
MPPAGAALAVDTDNPTAHTAEATSNSFLIDVFLLLQLSRLGLEVGRLRDDRPNYAADRGCNARAIAASDALIVDGVWASAIAELALVGWRALHARHAGETEKRHAFGFTPFHT